jgi:hypothetical protein
MDLNPDKHKKSIGAFKHIFKRYIPMAIIAVVGIFWIIWENPTKHGFYQTLKMIIDNDYRGEIVYFLSFVIGGFHWYYSAKAKKQSLHIIVKTGSPLFDSLSTVGTLGTGVNSALVMFRGAAGEICNEEKFFATPGIIDPLYFGIVIIVLLVICYIMFERLIKETYVLIQTEIPQSQEKNGDQNPTE